MSVLTAIAAGIAAIFTLLTLLGIWRPKLGLARTREHAFLRNGLVTMVAYVVMAISIGAHDPNQNIPQERPAVANAHAATPSHSSSRH